MTLHSGPEQQRAEAHGVERKGELRPSRAGSLFTGVTVGAVAVLVLLIFLLQNDQSQRVEFLWWSGELRAGLALLLAAALGALLVAGLASARVLELRRIARSPRRGASRPEG